jgi:hypothetical protein
VPFLYGPPKRPPRLGEVIGELVEPKPTSEAGCNIRCPDYGGYLSTPARCHPAQDRRVRELQPDSSRCRIFLEEALGRHLEVSHPVTIATGHFPGSMLIDRKGAPL